MRAIGFQLGDFFVRLILEDDMATFTRSQKLLASAGAAALGGSALLTAAELATSLRRVRAQPPRTHRHHSSARIFRSATRLAATGVPNMLLRLAQTEVPRAEMSVATLRAGLRGHRAAAVGRPRLHRLQDHDRERARSGLFRSGPAAHLRLQSRRGAARVPHGAEARS